MKEKELVIKKLRGEDGYKTFSVRLHTEQVERLDALARESGRSRNELIALLLEYAIENCRIEQ